MIRLAIKEDLEKINELGLLINNKFNKLFDMASIINEEISRVFVYVENNVVIGFLHITKLYEIVDIINVVVDVNHRRSGIASNLLDYMLSDISNDVKLVTLEVNVNNEAAVNIYKKMGFKVINERKNYYGTENAYLMGKGEYNV